MRLLFKDNEDVSNSNCENDTDQSQSKLSRSIKAVEDGKNKTTTRLKVNAPQKGKTGLQGSVNTANIYPSWHPYKRQLFADS